MFLTAHISANVIKIQTKQYRSTVKEIHQIAWNFDFIKNVIADASNQKREKKSESNKNKSENKHKDEAKKTYDVFEQNEFEKNNKS